MEEELIRFKSKKRKSPNKTKSIKKNISNKLIIKTLISIIITLTVLIMSKSSKYLDKKIKKYVFTDNLNISKYMNKYSKYFSEFLPFENLFKVEPVFSQKLEYKSKNKYLDGVVLKVDKSYLVPSIKSGLVVFVGEKEGYGKVVIVQQIDGIDTWYGNLKSSAVELYDYIESGILIGEVNEESLYIVLEKEGKFIESDKYI
ncbi:MAG TPA: M23 family metallopeptidase [Bacilli bacterium]|nr:M23 family metallopeptidase [Bacilli bacterium]